MDSFIGKWNNVSSENFDAYLKEIGVGMMTRTVASKLKPTLTFEKNGDEWVMTSISTFKTHVTKFKLGTEFDDKTIDGRDVKCTFKFEDNKLIQVEKGVGGGKDSTITRYIDGGKLYIVAESGSVKSTRVYEKAQ